MVKNNGGDREDELMKTAYKGVDKDGKLIPKTWCYCADCTVRGHYEWCPNKADKFALDAEDGCPLGQRVLH